MKKITRESGILMPVASLPGKYGIGTFINRKGFDSDRDLAFSFIKLAMGSVSKLCIIPMQDWLGLGDEARINTPSTLGGNWVWRMKRGAFTKKLAADIQRITKLYARL